MGCQIPSDTIDRQIGQGLLSGRCDLRQETGSFTLGDRGLAAVRFFAAAASLLISGVCQAQSVISVQMGTYRLDEQTQQIDDHAAEFYHLPKMTLALQLMYPIDVANSGRGLWAGVELANVSYDFESASESDGELSASSVNGRIAWIEPAGRYAKLYAGVTAGLMYADLNGEVVNQAETAPVGGIVGGVFIDIGLYGASLVFEYRRLWDALTKANTAGQAAMVGVALLLR